MGFPIPANDPGPPSYVEPPDEIRSSTLRGLLERDRFIFATGRRCLLKLGGRVAETGAPVVIAAGQAKTSAIVTGKVWIVASGYDCTVAVALGSGSVSFTLGGGFDTYSYLHVGWITPNSTVNFAVSLYGDPGRLYGLAVYEERLPESLLP